MSGSYRERTESHGFDPFRHRKEIELMEERFRERAERSGGGPVSTGEIDSRVQDEMQAFFAESAERLESVVPGIAEQGQSSAKESTAEIRKKIDDFFAQVPDEPVAQEPAAEAPRPAASSPRPAPTSHPTSSSAAGESAGKLDLRTALERLRRGGVVKDSAASSPPPNSGGSLRSSDVAADRRRRPAEPPARAEPVPPRAAAPQLPPMGPGGAPARGAAGETVGSVREPTAALPQPGERRLNPDDVAAEDIRIVPERKFQPTLDDQGRPPETQSIPRAGMPSFGAASSQLVDGRTPDRRPRAVEPVREERRSRDEPRTPAGPAASSLPPLPQPRARAAARSGPFEEPTPPATVTRRPARPAPRPQPQPQPPAPTSQPVADDAAGSFDAIFDEVQDLVLDTLKGSVAESFESARRNEDEFRRATEPEGDLLECDLEAELEAEERGQAPVASASEVAPAPQAPPARVAPTTPEAPPVAPAPAKPTTGSVLPPPVEDELDEVEADEAPAGPYDWGVKRRDGPPGAWLLADDEDDAPEAQPAPEPAAASPAAGGAGARGFLMRKLSDQVQQMGPVVEALERRGVIDADDLADPAAVEGDDDELSVDSFAGRPRIDLEQELSPTRLVEELRRLRRMQDALLRKGVVTEDDLAYTHDDE